MKEQIPLLFLSDAISAPTGLARITRDLSTRAHQHLSDVFRVGVAGYGAAGSRHFPFPQYNLALDGWICPNLPEIWEDFSGGRTGICFCIWDASRLSWFSRPELSDGIAKYPHLKEFLTHPPFRKWLYAPVDASGPNNRLSWPLAQNLLGFERILAYGKWGEDVIRRTLGAHASRDLQSLPHGIDRDTFYARDRAHSRAFFFAITGASTIRGEKELIQNDETLIGIVATNQSRKDFGLALETVSILSQQRKVRLWIHTDTLERSTGWSIPSLIVDFGLLDRTVVSLGGLSDDALAKAYSACDITIAPGAEGFGFPIAESLSCGTPVVTGSYGGGAELAPLNLVSPAAFRLEGIWGCERPVYQANSWAEKINTILECPSTFNSHLSSQYDWKNNWAAWAKWLREGSK